MTEQTQFERALEQLSSDLKEVQLGRRIGFYLIIKELGSGSFSKVKLASHRLTKEKVAIKIMDKAEMNEKMQKMLMREIQAFERLNHPNIIKLFEHIETSLRVHLVLEYASGGDLYEHIVKNGKMSEAVAKAFFAQIVSAVAYMHSRNLVHRDIKAENIMFSNPNTVKLGDFGFSCLTAEDELLRTFCGSLPYAAPELLEDDSYFGKPVDVWALGVLLFYMLVGVTPFKGELAKMKTMIMNAKFELPDHITSLAADFIKAMLAPDFEMRLDIEHVKKNSWMKNCRFTESDLFIEASAEVEDVAEKKAMNDKIWKEMNRYGITQQMLAEVNPEKGPRDAATGTYRIVQFQVQREMAKKAKEQDTSLPSSSSTANGSPSANQTSKPKNSSKTCLVL